MAPKSMIGSLRVLNRIFTQEGGWIDPLSHSLIPRLSRAMASEAPMRVANFPPSPENIQSVGSIPDPSIKPSSDVLTTVYSFPTMEPLRFEHYPSNQLYLPLRRDILHRAVIYEGDATRQGTASTKWRGDVYGSNRKIRRQKGLGRARLGDKKSPMLKGGGVAFGPHPRDFSTELPRKMYDLAWRTALSYRYRKGELIIVEDGIDIEFPKARYGRQVFENNHWGNADGRSLIVTSSLRKNLFLAFRNLGAEGRVLRAREVDVKDLLELGRIIIEKKALDSILREHQSDLSKSAPSAI